MATKPFKFSDEMDEYCVRYFFCVCRQKKTLGSITGS